MSAILGFVSERPRTLHLTQLRRAFQSLESRGLDDRAMLVLDTAGSTQLFLDPVSEHMHSSNSSYTSLKVATAMLAPCYTSGADRILFLAFDGVVDNVPELSRELQKLGRAIRPTSQPEVLFAALELWGPYSLSLMTGSFAFAVVDLLRRSVILARDAFGTRPLYYARPKGAGVHFSSDIGALLELASLARKVNRASLYRYLAYNTMEHGAETFFDGIEQVRPGHYLEVSLDQPTQLRLIRYPRSVVVGTKSTFEEAAEHVRELVTKAVVSQVGDHTVVGAAFSGGFDSSFVAGAFERANLGGQLKLYNCVPVVKKGEFSQSEEAWAHLAAQGLKAPLKKVRVTSENLPATFSTLIKLHEQPFSSPVVFAQLQVFRAAQSDGVKLMLSGQGGDTIFAPSTDQLLRAVLKLIRRGRWYGAGALLWARSRLPHHDILRLVGAAARLAWPEAVQTLVGWRRRASTLDWLEDEWFGAEPPAPEGQLGLPMFRFEDCNSMACSILNRMPLLTTELKDFVCSLPPEYLIRADQPVKSLEVAAMRGMVPNAILERRERSGFPVPVREWLDELAPWVETNIAELGRFPFLVERRVHQIWENVRSNGESLSEAFLVWRWIFLAGWARFFNVRWD